MKNFIILICLTVFTLLLSGLEYWLQSPMEIRLSEIIGGIILLIIGLAWCHRLHYKPKKMFMTASGGIMLIFAVNAAINALYLWRTLLDSYPDMSDGVFLCLAFAMAVYVPFVYIGAIWLYLYYFCDLRDVLYKIKHDI